MRGVSLKAVQELLGHATIEMTMRYAHLSPDVKRDAVQLLDRAWAQPAAANSAAVTPASAPQGHMWGTWRASDQAAKKNPRQPERLPGARWSGKTDLNRRPSPWQGDALPLSYSRKKIHDLGVARRRFIEGGRVGCQGALPGPCPGR